jgi:hypothetical protein
VELICPTAQAEHLRQIGTTGKSVGEREILSSEAGAVIAGHDPDERMG